MHGYLLTYRPAGVPHMRWWSAVTSELFDLIVELHPDTTSAGLAEHIKCE